MAKRTVWLVSELYYPEETSTGYLLQKAAEGLTSGYPVAVICGQPNYSKRGTKAKRKDTYNGVKVFRVWSTTYDRRRLLPRILNAITLALSTLFALLFKVRRGDVVMVVTTPPTAPYVVLLATKLKRAKFILILYDLYPDVLTVTGVAEQNSLVVRVFKALNKWISRQADHIVVPGQDMLQRAVKQYPLFAHKITVIPHFSDNDSIQPAQRSENKLALSLGIAEKFVVQYCGNLGKTHGVECVLSAANELRSQPNIHFLFVGSGAKVPAASDFVRRNSLNNVTLYPNQPRSLQNEFLNAADVMVIPYLPGMSGVSVPSRLFNMLAAAKPIIAVADKDSEAARIITTYQIGWVVPPNNSSALAELILNISQDQSKLASMGLCARKLAEELYSIDLYQQNYQMVVSCLAA